MRAVGLLVMMALVAVGVPVGATISSPYLQVDDVCPIYDGQGPLGLGNKIYRFGLEFAWSNGGSFKKTHYDIAKYWCQIAGHPGVISYMAFPRSTNTGPNTMFHQLNQALNDVADGCLTSKLANYGTSDEYKAVHQVVCTPKVGA
jgi:hypothetical protein